MKPAEALIAERKKIDEIDTEIVRLLEARMAAVQQVVKIKKAAEQTVLDSVREQEVLKRVAANVQQKDYLEVIQQTFEDIMSRSRSYQQKQLHGEE